MLQQSIKIIQEKIYVMRDKSSSKWLLYRPKPPREAYRMTQTTPGMYLGGEGGDIFPSFKKKMSLNRPFA